MAQRTASEKGAAQAHDWPALNQRVATSASRVVPVLIDLLQPRSVLDVGCGPGHWLRAFQAHGVSDVVGVDGPWVTDELLAISPRDFSARDLEAPVDLHRQFDLVVSLEVAEHLDPSAAGTFVRSLVRHSPVVLFGAAIPGQTGVGHVNEQWPDFWGDMFRAAGYVGFDWLRPRIWDDPEVCWWYAQNTFLYVSEAHLASQPELQRHLRGAATTIARAVHPGLWDYHRTLTRGETRDADTALRALWRRLPAPFQRRIRPLLRTAAALGNTKSAASHGTQQQAEPATPLPRDGVLPRLRPFLRRTRRAAQSLARHPGLTERDDEMKQLEAVSTTNFEENLSYWDTYPSIWDQRELLLMRADPESLSDVDINDFAVIGDEWGDRRSVAEVVDTCIRPYVSPAAVVGEVGCGGGRIARLVAPLVATLWCFDISPAMLERASKVLSNRPNVRFGLLTSAPLSQHSDGTFDFLYAFDVFVHLDLHTQWKYLQEFYRLLRPGGRAFLHTSNLTTDAGWQRFASQPDYSFDGFWFTSPELLQTLVERAGLLVTEEPALDPGNFYRRRDYLLIVERPPESRPDISDAHPPTTIT
jgi:SAM-dependent methyltransferase